MTWHYASLFASLNLPSHFLCYTTDGKSPIRARFTNEQHRPATTSTQTKALFVPFLIIPQIFDAAIRKKLTFKKTTSTQPAIQTPAQYDKASTIAKTVGNRREMCGSLQKTPFCPHDPHHIQKSPGQYPPVNATGDSTPQRTINSI